MEENLNNKKIVITGGTTGIGRATAMLLASKGAKVFIFGRHEKELMDAMNDISQAGDVVGIPADVAKKEDLDIIFQRINDELNGIDILINNAGIGESSLFENDYEHWEYMIDTNILGYFAMAQFAINKMKQSPNGGHIVNIGSVSADSRGKGDEIYSPTKAAVQAFSESVAKTIHNQGIKVSLIEPGRVGTDMQPESPEEQQELIDKKEMLKAEDIAQAVLFCLIQPERSVVNLLQIRQLIDND